MDTTVPFDLYSCSTSVTLLRNRANVTFVYSIRIKDVGKNETYKSLPDQIEDCIDRTCTSNLIQTFQVPSAPGDKLKAYRNYSLEVYYKLDNSRYKSGPFYLKFETEKSGNKLTKLFYFEQIYWYIRNF